MCEALYALWTSWPDSLSLSIKGGNWLKHCSLHHVNNHNKWANYRYCETRIHWSCHWKKTLIFFPLKAKWHLLGALNTHTSANWKHRPGFIYPLQTPGVSFKKKKKLSLCCESYFFPLSLSQLTKLVMNVVSDLALVMRWDQKVITTFLQPLVSLITFPSKWPSTPFVRGYFTVAVEDEPAGLLMCKYTSDSSHNSGISWKPPINNGAGQKMLTEAVSVDEVKHKCWWRRQRTSQESPGLYVDSLLY